MAMAAATPCTAMVAATVRTSTLYPSQPLCASPSRTRYYTPVLSQRRLHSTRPTSSRRALFSSGAGRRATPVLRAAIQEQEQTSSVSIKEFLEDLKAVGRVSDFQPIVVMLSKRISARMLKADNAHQRPDYEGQSGLLVWKETRLIVNTGVAVLESTVPNLDKLFYHVVPGRGEYANLMLKEENVDFHLLIDKVVSAKLETGKSMRGDIPTYMIRFMDNKGAVIGSLLVMWKPDSNGDFDDGQLEAYQNLVKKYGSDISFAANSPQ